MRGAAAASSSRWRASLRAWPSSRAARRRRARRAAAAQCRRARTACRAARSRPPAARRASRRASSRAAASSASWRSRRAWTANRGSRGRRRPISSRPRAGVDAGESVKRNVLPSPSIDSAREPPAVGLDQPRLIQSPRPVPVGRPWSRRKNLRKTCGRSASGMPSPWSCTATATVAVLEPRMTRMPDGAGVLGRVLDQVGEHLLDLVGVGDTSGTPSGTTTSAVELRIGHADLARPPRSPASTRSTRWRRRTSRPVSSRLMSSSSVISRVTRSASWWICSSIIRFWSSSSRSQRLSSSAV